MATTRAATPDGTVNSAHVTPPLPTTNSGTDPTAAFRQCRGDGRGTPERELTA